MKARRPLNVLIVSLLAYGIVWAAIYFVFQKGMSISVILPVMAVGWHFGFWAGLAAGALSLPLNIVVFMAMGLDWADKLFVHGAGVPGTIGVIFIGAMLGRLRELSDQLKQHRTRLQELIQEHTLNLQETSRRLSVREQDLLAANQQLKAREQELRAANKEMKANYQQLAASEIQARNAKEFLDNIFKTTADGIIVTDDRGHIVRVNRAVEQLLGYAEKELIGRATAEIVPQDEVHRRIATDMIQQLFETDVVQNREIDWLTKKGGLCRTEVNITLMRDANGQQTGSVATLRDITERWRAEQKVKKAEQFLTNVIENSPDFIIVSDSQGYITRVNRAFLQLLGFGEEAVIGKHIADFSPAQSGTYPCTTGETVEITQKYFSAMREQISRLHNEGKLANIDAYFIDSRKRLIPIEMSLVSLFDPEGNAAGSVAIARDVTERKKAEVERASIAAYLKRAEKMETIGTLAGGVAHDLNNVLGSIIGYPDLLLLKMPPDSPLRKPLLSIKGAAERAAAIVSDLLTLSRRGVQVNEVVNLNGIITGFLSSPEHKKICEYHHGLAVQTQLEPELLNVRGSSYHLTKTIMNLVANAAEAMPGGGTITITTGNRHLDRPLRRYDSVAEGDYAVVSVSDTGDGIDPASMEKIFEPFYTKKTMGRSGTGLGLAVVWGTVRDHDGYIEVQSSEEAGTTFMLYFPITREQAQQQDKPVTLKQYKGHGEKVLVVDDIESQREIAAHFLETLNYEVATVASGEKALDYLQAQKVDLLLLDMIMEPGMDGLETYQKIVQVHPRQKAIIASGFSENRLVREAQRLGAGAYIKKPYTLEGLGLAVKAELEKS